MDHKQPVSRSKLLVVHWVDANNCAHSTAINDYGSGRSCLCSYLFHFGQTHKVTRIEELDCVHTVVGRENISADHQYLMHQWDDKFYEVTAHDENGHALLETRYLKSMDEFESVKADLMTRHGAGIIIGIARPDQLTHEQMVAKYC